MWITIKRAKYKYLHEIYKDLRGTPRYGYFYYPYYPYRLFCGLNRIEGYVICG